MARIPGFHPGGPGSIPGVGEKLFCLKFFYSVQKQLIYSRMQNFAKKTLVGESIVDDAVGQLWGCLHEDKFSVEIQGIVPSSTKIRKSVNFETHFVSLV